MKRFWMFHRHGGDGKFKCGMTERLLAKVGVKCQECGQVVRHERVEWVKDERSEVGE